MRHACTKERCAKQISFDLSPSCDSNVGAASSDSIRAVRTSSKEMHGEEKLPGKQSSSVEWCPRSLL